VSRNSKLGYAGERPIEVLLQERGVLAAARPRAGRQRDCGDISGAPLVLSVKNVKHQELAKHVTELESMVLNAGVSTGVLWHKRRGKGSPLDWYVTTSGRLFLPLLDLAIAHLPGEVH
jgi:hypothetical protein